MNIAVPNESAAGERRVALIPAVVPALVKAGMTVTVEKDAGAAAGYPDARYEEKGATICSNRADLIAAADVVAYVKSPSDSDLPLLKKGQLVIGFLDPLSSPVESQKLAERGVTAFAMEMIPRITRAQAMDALSSMASIAGYKAVLLAAGTLPRIFPMMMTAAGTITAAKVFIMGAGVAGLQAIGTARRLGAVVQAFDVRSAVKEQVLSLGAKFVELPIDSAAAEGTGGYAAAQSEEFLRKQRELMAKVVAESDVVITTAAIPGKKSPILVTAEMARGMAPGSVIVDLAAERGGNCELTKAGETIVDNGVTIMGPVNLPGEVPYHASQMYSKNVTNLLLHLISKDGLKLDLQDEITRETMVAHEGEVTNPRMRELLGLPAVTPVMAAG